MEAFMTTRLGAPRWLANGLARAPAREYWRGFSRFERCTLENWAHYSSWALDSRSW